MAITNIVGKAAANDEDKHLPNGADTPESVDTNNDKYDIEVGETGSDEWRFDGSDTLFYEFFALQEGNGNVTPSYRQDEVVSTFPETVPAGESATATNRYTIEGKTVEVNRTVRLSTDASRLTITFEIENFSGQRIEDFRLYQYCDYDIVDIRDTVGAYLGDSGIIYQRDDRYDIATGFRGQTVPENHHVRDYYADGEFGSDGVLNGDLNNQDQYPPEGEDISYPDPIVALQWGLNDIPADGTTSFTVTFGAATDLPGLESLLGAAQQPDELPPAVRNLVDAKRARIESIRTQAGFLSELYDAGIDPESLDTVAEEFLDGLKPAEVREDSDQYEQALGQLVSAESITQETLDAFATSIGAFDKTLLRQYSDSYGKAAVSVALVAFLSKIASGGRFLGNTARFQNLADDLTAGFSQLLDDFVPASKTLDDLAATYDEFARDKIRYEDLYLERLDELNAAYATVATEGVKNEPFDIALLDAFEEAEDEVSNFIGSMTTEYVLTESAVGPSTIPLGVGPLRRSIPELPDSISVPFSSEAEDAGDLIGGVIEETADQAGGISDEIKELDSYRIQELEDVDVSIPDEIELPEWFELPDTVEIPQLRFDLAEPLGDISDVLDVTTQSIDTELQADVTKLVDALQAGDLKPQDLDLRDEFTQVTRNMVQSLRDLADDAWNGLNIIQAGLEVINTGLAGLFLIGIVIALAAVLATNGLSTILIPVLAVLLEIIGIIIGIIQAAAVLIGYGFINLLTRVHTLGVNGLLTDDLEDVPL